MGLGGEGVCRKTKKYFFIMRGEDINCEQALMSKGQIPSSNHLDIDFKIFLLKKISVFLETGLATIFRLLIKSVSRTEML